jgi:hypothetical protein
MPLDLAVDVLGREHVLDDHHRGPDHARAGTEPAAAHAWPSAASARSRSRARPRATIWKKYGGASGGQSAADFGDLEAGGMQPITGPIYRYDEDNAGQGAFPRYYDGSWFINNRGSDNGLWKEVKLRKDNNQMLRVQDWLPYNAGSTTSAQNSSLVIGTQFGPTARCTWRASRSAAAARARTPASRTRS